MPADYEGGVPRELEWLSGDRRDDPGREDNGGMLVCRDCGERVLPSEKSEHTILGFSGSETRPRKDGEALDDY